MAHLLANLSPAKDDSGVSNAGGMPKWNIELLSGNSFTCNYLEWAWLIALAAADGGHRWI
jgi:hypothetical protein